MTPEERYKYHNDVFDKWYAQVYEPGRKLFHAGELSSLEFANLQNKKKMLLRNIDLAEDQLRKSKTRFV